LMDALRLTAVIAWPCLSFLLCRCNLRASRSVPFVSKTFNVNFIELATKIMTGAPVKASRIELLDIDHVCVKVPMFSFTRLQGADPVLRVEMASTGEVACFSSRPLEAFLKGLLATGSFKLPTKQRTILLSLGPMASKLEFVSSAQTLISLGYVLYGTTGTAEFFAQHGVAVQPLHKPEHIKRAVTQRRTSVGPSQLDEEVARKAAVDAAAAAAASGDSHAQQDGPSKHVGDVVDLQASGSSSAREVGEKQMANILDVLKTGLIELVINVPNTADPLSLSSGYHIRRTAIDFSIPLISNMKNALMLTDCLAMMAEPDFQFEIKSWNEYLRDAKIEG
jgi:hypothetical protein